MIIIFVSTVFLCIKTKDQALALTEKEKSELDIRFYDPTDCSGGSNGTSTILAGNSWEEKIWNYLISKGLTDAQTAGLMGNFDIESGINPVCEVDNNCFGLAMICRSSGEYENARKALEDAGYGKYLGHPTKYSPYGAQEIPDEDIDGVLTTHLDFMYNYWSTVKPQYYPSYSGTMIDWIKEAKDPIEAAEIFMSAYENAFCSQGWGECNPPIKLSPEQWNSKNYGYQHLEKRRKKAQEYYEKYSGKGTSVNTAGTSSPDQFGDNVTIIGDSITYMSSGTEGEGITKYLPKATVVAQGSKHMFMDADSKNGGDSGNKILKGMRATVRDVLVIALGTNDPGAITKSDMQDLIDQMDKPSKIILVNNAKAGSPSTYASNNQVFNEIAAENDRVVVADWASIVEQNPTLISTADGLNVHPTFPEGVEAFGKLIYDTVGANNGSQTAKSSECNCGGGNTGAIGGGLSEEQAQSLADDYNTGDMMRWADGANSYDILDNCVSLSKYVIKTMTDLKWGGGNGDEVVRKLKEANPDLETGSEVRPYSIFSIRAGTLMHTGFIVAVNGDDVVAVEAAWHEFTGKVIHKSKSELESTGYEFAYIESHINKDALKKATGASSVSTFKSVEQVIVDVTWNDGWIESGIDGYKKESLFDHPEITPIDNSYELDYETVSPKTGWAGPNKITLHSTEGKNGGNAGSGLALYNSGGAPLSHFTIDLKEKKVYQHLPINKPASGVASHDRTAGVQIEIIGFSTKSSAGYSDDWYLQNYDAFGPTEWAYLAKLLYAIYEETGIPLKSDVDWASPKRLDANAYKEYEGIIAHMHVPDNSHTDPGNIWGNLSKQISFIASGDTDGSCAESTWKGDFPFMFQGDYGGSFKGGSYSQSGCGITSTAMAISALTGQLVTPPDLKNRLDCDSTGDTTCVKQWAEAYGLEFVMASAEEGVTNQSSDQAFKDLFKKYLSDGYIIVTSGKTTESLANDTYDGARRIPFSASGHYVVFYGLDDAGRWLIADPGGHSRPWAAECTDLHQCKAHDNAMDPEIIINHGLRRTDGALIRALRKKR